MQKKGKKHHKKKPKACDPAVCDDCVYVGEGDFACMQGDPVFVIEDWVQTEDYLRCRHPATKGGTVEEVRDAES